MNDTPSTIDRRALLARAAGLAAAAGIRLSPFAVIEAVRARVASADPSPGTGGRTFSAAEWATLEVVQEVLWPAGDGVPGAKQVRATAYLDAALADLDVQPHDLEVVRAGMSSLAALVRGRGATAFTALDGAARESVLVDWRDGKLKTEGGDGADWLRTVLQYTLEAVLCDPVHGGNVDEAGWKWLGYEPADPRPKAPPGGPR